MKFGKTVLAHQIPQWSVFYMNYKNLKKLIKNIDYNFNPEAEVSDLVQSILSQFFIQFNTNIEKVDNFYNSKIKEYNRRLSSIERMLNWSNGAITYNINSSYELDEILQMLVELKNCYRDLKWFGELNNKGFIKILKKLDKKLTILSNLSTDHLANDIKIQLPSGNKKKYLDDRNKLEFSNQQELLANLDTINELLNKLANSSIVPSINYDTLIDEYISILDEDNGAQLQAKVEDKSLKFLISLLIQSTIRNKVNCIDAIFDLLETSVKDNNFSTDNLLYDKFYINGRNFFHHLVLNCKEKSNVETQGLSYVLAKIDNEVSYRNLRFLLNAKDNNLRTPLHYCGKYGINEMCRVILNYLKKWNLIDNLTIDDIKFWGDHENLTPIHLSIINKHPLTTQYLLVYSHTTELKSSNLILLAARLNSPEILGYLLKFGKIDINYTDSQHNNETALYIAAKLNLPVMVEFLLQNNADTELGEMDFGWTPIFVAASEGYQEIVHLLINANCKIDLVDDSGWLPMEHASLRGHLQVADLLKPKNYNLLLYDMNNPNNNVQRTPVSKHLESKVDANPKLVVKNSLMQHSNKSAEVASESSEVYKRLKQFDRSKSPSRIKPVKSFGHTYLSPDETMILITLGSTDSRDLAPPIKLKELDTPVSLVVTCSNKQRESIETSVIDLPLDDPQGFATDPITFKLTNNMSINDVIITFDIVPTYQYKDDNADGTLARAVAFLDEAYTKVGDNLRSLNSLITASFIDKTLDVIGSIRFEFFYVKLFQHPNLKYGTDTYWKTLVSTRVIGHRGLGKNINDKSLQLGENTLESFIAAASLGASYVEFDVQLTKDHVPVIYHDFTVAESGVDIPMHCLTAEQFLHLNDPDLSNLNIKNTSSIDIDSFVKYFDSVNGTSPNGSSYALDDEVLSKVNRPRSMGTYKSTPNMNMEDIINKESNNKYNGRMKLTKTWKDKGYKGNARGLQIASNFVTLKDLFRKLPKHVGFNIEVKYPMLDEAQNELMGEIAFDMNFFVDTILTTVYNENLDGRDIIFSSFHPDICLLLSLKQPSIPILYLTEAGTAQMADVRANSLQNAIRFAKNWDLLGLVSAAETLIKTPRLAQIVKASGLVCVTYGTLNNDPENCKIQMKAGVDAVIADKVLAVRQGLTKEDSWEVKY